ncbi:unnamed protein product [Parajaminaea phylloscopi]
MVRPRGARFIDVTEEFQRACSGLYLGQMVHPTSFTLLDTMACISIGDPKMDSGIYPVPQDLVPDSDQVDVPSEDTLVTFNPHLSLSLQDVIWIVDRLLACEASFHSSSPLAQTLFTSLHFHDLSVLRTSPDTTLPAPGSSFESHPSSLFILRAILIAIVKSFDQVRQELSKGNVMEGEDTSTDTCGLSVLEEAPVGFAFQALQEATDLLSSWQTPGIDASTTSTFEALLLRLGMRRRILMLVSLFGEQLNPSTPAESRMDSQTMRRAATELCDGLSKDLTILAGDGPLSLRSANRREAPSLVAAASFDPSYARRLPNAGGIPPQQVQMPDKSKVVKLWRDMCRHWTQAAAMYETVVTSSSSRNRWEKLEALVWTHGCLFEREPTTAYARSLYQSCLCSPSQRQPELLDHLFASATRRPCGALSNHLNGILDTMNEAAQPASKDQVVYGRDAALQDEIQRWYAKGEGLLGNVLLDGLANRPRARRCLAKSYPRWRAWTAESDQLDVQIEAWGRSALADVSAFPPGTLRAIVQHQSLRLALDQSLSALDLDLTGTTELTVTYWVSARICREASILEGELASVGRSGDKHRWEEACQYEWQANCLEAWLALALLCESEAGAHVRRAPWTLTEGHRKSIYLRRFKWLLLPLYGATGERQNKFEELDTLWDEYADTCISKSSADCVSVAKERLLDAQESVRRWAGRSRTDARWALCRPALNQIQDTLQASITRSLHTLAHGVLANRIDSGSAKVREGTQRLGFALARSPPDASEHPWFPSLIEITCT